MESSAKGLLQVMNWVKLKRDKSNYVPWQRSVKEVLEAMGCEAAITKGFAKLTLHADDDDSSSSSSSEDSDDLPEKQAMFFGPHAKQLDQDFDDSDDDQEQKMHPQQQPLQPSSTPSKQARGKHTQKRRYTEHLVEYGLRRDRTSVV